MTKAPIPIENSKEQKVTTLYATKYFDYTTIVGRLRAVSWSYDSHATSVFRPVYGIPTFPLTTKAV